MDQQRLVELLQASQIPDTQKVKAATAELRKNFYPHPESLIGLLHVIVSNPESTVRMLAAVQALRLVPKHWEKIADDQKPAVRNELLQAILREQDAKCRHGQSRVIAAIATLDFESEQWTDLLPAVMQLNTSDDVTHREIGSYIVFSLLETNPAYFEDHLSTLFELFAKTIRDPQSRDVRVNTMQSISALLMLVDCDDDEQSVNAVQGFVPVMVDVLKDAVDSGDDEKIQQSFEVFQSFLAYDPALISRYFKDLVQFMLDLAVNTNAEDDVRSQALSFLAQCVKYRRMKVQGIPDMGAQLMKKGLAILSELDDDDDEEDTTPARTALSLIDQLATDLPPRQVIVPLLDEFANYAGSQNPGQRKACVLALGTCAEGAPEFVSTQIASVMPMVLHLLKDPEQSVRHSALLGLIRLGEDLSDSMASHHDDIMTALVMNLDASSGDESDKKNVDIIRSVCGAVDSLAEGLGPDVMAKYGDSMIRRIGTFLSHPDPKVKSSAAGALGAIAASIKSAFNPYLKETMEAMSSYILAESGEEELALRSSICDAMGRIAVGVGAQEFSPYVIPLLVASEKALHLGNPRLRETTFILWSQLATVYEGDLGDSLSGIFKGLFDSLELEEEDVELDIPADQDGLVDEEVVLAGKKLKVKNSEDADGDDADLMDDDDDDDDWDDLVGVSAQAFEKEIALEVLGDVIYAAKEKSAPYIERAVELVAPFAEHSYEGCRKTALGTLWRTYACVWEVMEKQTGRKWEPGLPMNFEPVANILKLGEIVSTATLHIWPDESDRDVVTEINRSVASTLKTCGPAILSQKEMMQQIVTVLGTIITRSHPCQLDLGEEEEDPNADHGSSEWDWLVVDTALDVLIGLACALGLQFAEVWKVFEKPIVKLLSSNEAIERSTAVGVVAECVAYMSNAVTPYTPTLLRPLLHRLSDEDKETKSNAAYAIGQLVYHSDDAKTYLPTYSQILGKLEPLLQIKDARLQDNAAGCLCRMILAHPDQVPIADVLPALVDLLPLKEDYEENKPVYQCLHHLYTLGNPTVQELTPKLLNVFQQVLGPPEEQLEPETRQVVQGMVAALAK
ncbi:importin beta-4 subunit-like protein [Hypoxylon trugodes]|uniref:importin beta-4 subunit-like protein n=1 Tax=Hypoxylon trugodes TaxID=326681 RepID=UPI00219B586E|nr:importin beta-4 subunit-like protein [Hypoxylon trugodes]KAI1387118.1 importin beta-4 subunit-like protein [Hypoxylon trugodes]